MARLPCTGAKSRPNSLAVSAADLLGADEENAIMSPISEDNTATSPPDPLRSVRSSSPSASASEHPKDVELTPRERAARRARDEKRFLESPSPQRRRPTRDSPLREAVRDPAPSPTAGLNLGPIGREEADRPATDGDDSGEDDVARTLNRAQQLRALAEAGDARRTGDAPGPPSLPGVDARRRAEDTRGVVENSPWSIGTIEIEVEPRRRDERSPRVEKQQRSPRVVRWNDEVAPDQRFDLPAASQATILPDDERYEQEPMATSAAAAAAWRLRWQKRVDAAERRAREGALAAAAAQGKEKAVQEHLESEPRGSARSDEEADAGAGTPLNLEAGRKDEELKTEAQDFFHKGASLGDVFQAKRGELVEKMTERQRGVKSTIGMALPWKERGRAREREELSEPVNVPDDKEGVETAPRSRGPSPAAAKPSPFTPPVRPPRPNPESTAPLLGSAHLQKYVSTKRSYSKLPEVQRQMIERTKKQEFLSRRNRVRELDSKWRAKTKASLGETTSKTINHPPMVYGTY